MNFLTIIFLVGISIATLQDIKRREVDNWLNLTLILISIAYLLYTPEKTFLAQAGLSFFIIFILSYLFYYGRVFAGGDAKLLFALALIFTGTSTLMTIMNITLFILLLMISGSLYGVIYSLTLYAKHYTKVNQQFTQEKKNPYFILTIITGILLLGLGYVNTWFIILGILITGFPLVYVFAKALEHEAMIKTIPGKQVREGDWLAHDITLRKKKIFATWEGVSKQELPILQKLKHVTIKDGMPFVPAFLIAYLAYLLLKEQLLSTLLNII